jgi:hypothetical protein
MCVGRSTCTAAAPQVRHCCRSMATSCAAGCSGVRNRCIVSPFIASRCVQHVPAVGDLACRSGATCCADVTATHKNICRESHCSCRTNLRSSSARHWGCYLPHHCAGWSLISASSMRLCATTTSGYLHMIVLQNAAFALGTPLDMRLQLAATTKPGDDDRPHAPPLAIPCREHRGAGMSAASG